MSEITLGIVVASVPTLGPIYFGLGAKWVPRKSSKPSDNEDTPRNGHLLPTIGSVPLRPQKKRSLYNDDSLLRSQPEVEQDASDWPSQQIIPQALSAEHRSTAARSMGYHWHTEVNGDTARLSLSDRRGRFAGDIPHSAIMRNVEYAVHEWQPPH